MLETPTAPLFDPNRDSALDPRAGIARRGLLRSAVGIALTAAGVVAMPNVDRTASASTVSLPVLPRLPAPPPPATASATDLVQWRAFCARFVAPEGRVVDASNGDISHSEGQGYAMLLATWANDRPMFERLLNWTQTHLIRPNDSLHAWSWHPYAAAKVPDTNTATDGELSIAWALLRASDRWAVPQWRELAVRMGNDILATALRSAGGRRLLAPGAQGFDRADYVVINPSYYNFPAIRALARATGDLRWVTVETDGLWLLQQARYGHYGLPPDWVEVRNADAAVMPGNSRKLMFSWDALRVPLFLTWAGEFKAPALAAAVNFWRAPNGGAIPAWANLRTNTVAPYAGHAGVVAIERLSVAALTGKGRMDMLPAQASAPDYYAGALALLARVAWQESGIMVRSGMVMAQS